MLNAKQLEYLDRGLTIATIVAIAIFFWGILLNKAVIAINHGSMPVFPSEGTFFFTSPHHHLGDEFTALPLLADRIHVRFPTIALGEGFHWDAFKNWAEFAQYPILYEHAIVSVGDIMSWLGAFLAPIFFSLLLLRIPFRLQKDGIRYTPRFAENPLRA